MKNNKRIGTLDQSGRDTSDKPYLIFYDISELKKSLKICVKQCPSRTLNTVDDLYDYVKTSRNNLCKYDFNYEDLRNRTIADKTALTSTFGPCPKLPIYEGYG